MAQAIITFDLADAQSQDYKLAYQLLEAYGFAQKVQGTNLVLPFTTVMGPMPMHHSPLSLRDALAQTFKSAGLTLACILVGELVGDKWAMERYRA